jgi:ABC-type transport system involved in multi-copper enzyme maturation permease subunit
MFLILLLITFLIALVVSFIVVKLFSPSIEGILKRIIADEISKAWLKYMKFAIFVVGISSGVRIWELEKYITPSHLKDATPLELTGERWILEVYRTVIDTLQGLAWLLLVFFIFALIAYVIVRIFELKKEKPTKSG